MIATGFSRGPRKAAPTPVDLANYMTTPQPQATAQAAAAAASGADVYRKTPNARRPRRRRPLRPRRAGVPAPQGQSGDGGSE